MFVNHKTLIGKNNYLFLINDTCNELEVHCNNLDLVSDKTLKRYNMDNFLLMVFPNKSLIYKDYLPEKYNIKYRPAFDNYKNVLGEKVVDTYDILKIEDDVYYKTDTHINLKGSYIVYKYFIEKINKIYNLNIQCKNINILSKNCILTDLPYGIGDLLWKSNIGDQYINDINKIDKFYYSNDIEYLYYSHKISKDDKLRILDKELNDVNSTLEGSLVSWEILSDNILYKKNDCNNNLKVLFFYDSFLISSLDLYLSMFEEVYMVKDVYNQKHINQINPNYIFEFRVERFLF